MYYIVDPAKKFDRYLHLYKNESFADVRKGPSLYNFTTNKNVEIFLSDSYNQDKKYDSRVQVYSDVIL